MKSEKLTPFAPVVLRITLSIVYLWFGISQITRPEMWTTIVPSWAILPGMSADVIVHLNGYFEIIAGILLVLGIAVRPVALLLFLHMLPIVYSMGLGAIGIRDFGLSFATFAVFLYGADRYSLKLGNSVRSTGE